MIGKRSKAVMTHQWEPEKLVDQNLAMKLIQEQFPDLLPQSIRLLGVGWDNSAFLLNEKWVFRFPRRSIAVPLLETEWCVLRKIAPHLPLSVPMPIGRGNPCEDFSWPFIYYKMIPGITACSANLSEEERTSLAEPLGSFLATLHAVPKEKIAECSIQGDNHSRINGVLLTEKIQNNLKELSSLGLLKNEKQLKALIQSSQSFRSPSMSSIVHGDFYVRHLLVNDMHKLSGVIDWGDLHIGDPAIDLAIAHSFLPIKAHSAFIKAYGDIPEDVWTLAKLRALFSSTMLAVFGHHSQDLAIKQEGLRALNVMATGCADGL